MKFSDLKYLKGHWFAPTGKHVEAYAMCCFPEFGANEYVDVCTGIRYALVIDELASCLCDKDVHRLIRTDEPGFPLTTRKTKKQLRKVRIGDYINVHYNQHTRQHQIGRNRFFRRHMHCMHAEKLEWYIDLPF